MPPKKSLPNGFEESKDGVKISCISCSHFQEDSQRRWINRTSLVAHLRSVEHEKNLATWEELQIQRRREQQRRDAAELEYAQLLPGQALPDKRVNAGEKKQRVVTAEETMMWESYERDGADFSAGAYPNLAARAAFEHDLDNFILEDPQQLAEDLGFVPSEENDEASDNQHLEELVHGLDEEDDSNVNNAGDYTSLHNSQWAPYDSKTMCLLDTIDNMPRLRLSDSLMRVFLWLLREAGAKDVPTFYRLRQVQKNLREKCGIPTLKCESPQGNIFYMNDPRALVSRDWANPQVRSHIHVYPEIPDSEPISEVWHGEKWCRDMDLDALSPMYDSGEKHYYVNELTKLDNGMLVIPFRWVIWRKTVHAQSWPVVLNEHNEACVQTTHPPLMVPAPSMRQNYYDLEYEHQLPKWSNTSQLFASAMPNPLRAVAGGDPLYTSFVDYFGDDVSGNRSKSWNKHWNAYMTHRNLPRKLLQQEFHIHFLSTSPNASIPEQFTEFKKVIETTHQDPLKVYDATTGQGARLRIFVNAQPSDNPMQSEVSSHIGGNGNLPCRKCNVGGTGIEKESTDGYESLFKPGTPRSKADIVQSLESQLRLACRGVLAPIKDIQTATGVKDTYTQYWIDYLLDRAKTMKKSKSRDDVESELVQWLRDNFDRIYSGFLTLKGFDSTKDTPVEILHTILLGLVKYGWHSTHTSWTPAQKSTYALRLQSTNTSGLSIHAIRANYIMQYAGSLIGRQLKTLSQTTIFHVHDLVSPLQFQVWRSVGELAALLWVPEIYNLTEYLNDIDIAVGNVLDSFAESEPAKIIQKIKLHLQVHLRQDILRFGPLVGLSTEGFESFNAIFRFCSILSNHLAPSRDIARQLADQEGLKHRLTGGWWLADSNDHVKAGWGVQDMMIKHPVLQRLIGWNTADRTVPGSAKAKALPKGASKHVPMLLAATSAGKAVNSSAYTADSLWIAGRTFIAQSEDECSEGSWVFTQHQSEDEHKKVLIGQVREILISQSKSSHVLVVLDMFQVANRRHDKLGMPYVQRRLHDEPELLIVAGKDVMFIFNAQHDCQAAGCRPTGQRPRMQERIETTLVDNFIEHQHNTLADRYIINMHAFHNAHLLRLHIPRSLSAPIPIHQDRAARHALISSELREAQAAKRADKKEKRAAKKAAEQEAQADENESTDGENGMQRRQKRKRTEKPPRLAQAPAESVA